MNRLLKYLAATLLLTATPAADAQVRIELRTSARAPSGNVTLAQIASIEGDRADELGRIVVIAPGEDQSDADRLVEIGLAQVRGAIAQTAPDLDWGATALSGRTCTVVIGSPARPGHADESARETPFVIAGEIPPGTVRAIAASRIAAALSQAPDNVQLRFDENDSTILDHESAGLSVAINTLGIGNRMDARVRIYDGDRLLESGTITTEVRVRQGAAVAARQIPRGASITEADFRAEDRWLPPSGRAANPLSLENSSARISIPAGRVITETDVRTPTAVSRGDIVIVHCVSGSLVMQTKARALRAATEGETIEFETLEPEWNHRRRFVARMSGPGIAVMTTQSM